MPDKNWYSVTNNSPNHRVIYHAGRSGGTNVPMKGSREIEMTEDEMRNAQAQGVVFTPLPNGPTDPQLRESWEAAQRAKADPAAARELNPSATGPAQREAAEDTAPVPQPGGPTTKPAVPGAQYGSTEPTADRPNTPLGARTAEQSQATEEASVASRAARVGEQNETQQAATATGDQWETKTDAELRDAIGERDGSKPNKGVAREALLQTLRTPPATTQRRR
jgi:hypothetical protein